MQHGVVKWYDPQMGYGIVSVANGRLVMVHAANLAGETPSLRAGQEVTLQEGPFIWGKNMRVGLEVRPAQ
jgi:cold shock CspA family protein